MPKTTPVDMYAFLDAVEAERERRRSRPLPSAHRVDLSTECVEYVDGYVSKTVSVGPSASVRFPLVWSCAGLCVACLCVASVPLPDERGPSSLDPSPRSPRASSRAPAPPSSGALGEGDFVFEGARRSAERGERVVAVRDALVCKFSFPLERGDGASRAPRWLSVPKDEIHGNLNLHPERISRLLLERHRGGALWAEVLALRDDLVLGALAEARCGVPASGLGDVVAPVEELVSPPPLVRRRLPPGAGAVEEAD